MLNCEFRSLGLDHMHIFRASMDNKEVISVCFYHNLLFFSGLSVDIDENDLKYALEGIEGMGQLSVQWQGTCRSPKWRVEWLTNPGDQPLIQVRILFSSSEWQYYQVTEHAV